MNKPTAVMIPVPTHLQNCLKRPNVPVSEEGGELVAPVVCPCGCGDMELLYPGQTHEYRGGQVPCVADIDGAFFLRLAARCKGCGQVHLLLDMDLHGWNGFVCHDESQAALPRPPLRPWQCLSCSDTWHNLTIIICSDGKEFFIEETEGELPENRWIDGFGWFTISTHCTGCGLDTDGLIDYETA